MKILINAYAVRPNSGSEGGAAWNWIKGIVRHHELFVITEGEWKDEIEITLPMLPNHERVHFYYNPVSQKIRQMCWNQGDYRFYYFYAKWQKKTYEIAKEIVSQYEIDLVHQLNMIGFREPGYLWGITNIPFIWGPIGGMNQVPMQYLKDAPMMVRLKYQFKNVVSRWQFRCHPRVQKAIQQASVMIAANKASYDILTNCHPEKWVELINETGSNTHQMVTRSEHNDSKFKILWVGRFIPTKLLKMSLEVIKGLKSLKGLEFHIVGQAFDEKDTNHYYEMADNMGLGKICHWHGWVSHEEVQKLMQESDLFFFPSVVEGTPHVVLESIANGLPIVCFDACGQAEAVNETVGRKIALTEPRDSIKRFEEVITELYNDRSLLLKLSKGCEQRRVELSWERKVEKLETIYQQIAGKYTNCNG